MKILIVRLSAFGDIVHALPLAANAVRAGASVGWLCEARYQELLEGNPNVGRLFLADTRGWRRKPAEGGTRSAFAQMRGELAAFGADYTIDVQGLWKSAILARAARAPVVGFDSSERREGLSSLLASRKVRPPDSSRHIVDRNLALLSAVGIPVVEPAPDARYLLAAPSAEAAEFLASVRRPYALYHPGAGWPEKRWDPEKLAAVARALEARWGLFPVISWGPGDEAVVAILEAALPDARRMPRLSPALSRTSPRARRSSWEMTPDRSIWPTPSAHRRSRSSARRTPPAMARIVARHSSSMRPRRRPRSPGKRPKSSRSTRPDARRC